MEKQFYAMIFFGIHKLKLLLSDKTRIVLQTYTRL